MVFFAISYISGSVPKIFAPSSLRYCIQHGPLARYVKLRVANAPGMSVAFSPTRGLAIPTYITARAVTHVPWCMLGSLTSCFLWSRWRRKGSQHSWRMCNPLFYVSGKRPMVNTKVTRILLVLTRGNSRETKSVPKLLLPWLRASPCYQLSFFWLCRLKTGPWFNIKMSSCQFRKSHCEDKTILRSYYLHNGISYTGKMISLYWISPQVLVSHEEGFQLFMTVCTILVSRNDRKRKNTSWSYDYRKTSSIKRTKYQNLNDSLLVLQWVCSIHWSQVLNVKYEDAVGAAPSCSEFAQSIEARC